MPFLPQSPQAPVGCDSLLWCPKYDKRGSWIHWVCFLVGRGLPASTFSPTSPHHSSQSDDRWDMGPSPLKLRSLTEPTISIFDEPPGWSVSIPGPASLDTQFLFTSLPFWVPKGVQRQPWEDKHGLPSPHPKMIIFCYRFHCSWANTCPQVRWLGQDTRLAGSPSGLNWTKSQSPMIQWGCGPACLWRHKGCPGDGAVMLTVRGVATLTHLHCGPSGADKAGCWKALCT